VEGNWKRGQHINVLRVQQEESVAFAMDIASGGVAEARMDPKLSSPLSLVHPALQAKNRPNFYAFL